MKKIFYFILLFVFSSKISLNAQQLLIEGTTGVITPIIPIEMDNSVFPLGLRLTGGYKLNNQKFSINSSLSYNFFGTSNFVLSPYLKATFGNKFQFYLYGGPFGSFNFDNNFEYLRTTKYYVFSWGLNLGLGVNIKLKNNLYLIFDFRESFGMSPYGGSVATAQGGTIAYGYNDYKLNFGNPSVGIGFLLPEKNRKITNENSNTEFKTDINLQDSMQKNKLGLIIKTELISPVRAFLLNNYAFAISAEKSITNSTSFQLIITDSIIIYRSNFAMKIALIPEYKYFLSKRVRNEGFFTGLYLKYSFFKASNYYYIANQTMYLGTFFGYQKLIYKSMSLDCSFGFGGGLYLQKRPDILNISDRLKSDLRIALNLGYKF